MFAAGSPRNEQTYEEIAKGRGQKVQIRAIGGDDKRFATLIVGITATPGDEQPKLALVFAGKGTVYTEESHLYHRDVLVSFQRNAWVDQTVWVRYLGDLMGRKKLPDGTVGLCFVDNLIAHKLEAARRLMEENGWELHFTLTGATDDTMPLDAGAIAEIKVIFCCCAERSQKGPKGPWALQARARDPRWTVQQRS